MRKLVSLLMITVILVTSLCACKSSGNPKDSSDDTANVSVDLGNDSDANYDVKGTVTVGINSYRNSDFEALLNTFKKLYPNITVKPVVFESSSDDATEYLTNQTMSKKTMPDIIFDDAGSLPTYIQNGWMYPLTKFIKDDSSFKDVPQNIVDHLTYNGNIYALGQTLHSNVLIVNTDIVEEMNIDLPENDWNWDDFTSFIKSCTNSTYSGIEDLSEQYNWIPGAMNDGCSIVGYKYDTNSFDLSAVQKFVNYYFEIKNLGGVEATSLKQNSSSGKSDYSKKFGNVSGSDAAFTAGKVASAFTGTWQYATWNSKELDFNWDLYPVPQTKAGRVPLHIDYSWMTTDVADENVDAAWEFLRFVTYSKEGNIARLTTYDEDHITNDLYNAYYIPCTRNKDIEKKFKDLPYVTDAVIYIYENFNKGYLGDPEKTVPGFEAVEYPIIGKIAYESICGKYDFTSRMADAQNKANSQIKEYLETFNNALAKFEKDFVPSN